jgi:DNA-binding response OmpR family regulator
VGAALICVIEDEAVIAQSVAARLKAEGFEVEVAGDGETGVELCNRTRPDLVVLDVMLPGLDGLEVCRRLRAKGRMPIIMLTARDQEVDKVLGLEMGADDYVTKPFSPRELVARVKAVLRRAAPEATEDDEVLSLGPVRMDLARRSVNAAGRDVELTPKEFDLLAFLVRNRGIVFGRDRLLERVWGYERPVDTRTVDSHVRSLRAKLGAEALVVRTVRGVGYKAEA